MRCGLVVTTYERPRALARVLESLATQTRWPDEVLIADDGSGPRTAELVQRFAATAARPVRHVWQPHDGFRAGRIRNEAICRADCEYLVLLDGDMVMHPEFIADHLVAAKPGYYSQGVRVQLDERASRRLEQTGAPFPAWFAPGAGLLRRGYMLRSRRLARCSRRLGNSLVSVKSCNQGFWREDLLRVNGFDETMVGWGSEDKELCARLENAGVLRQTLLFAALACHLAHPPAPRSLAGTNHRRWRETVRSGRTRCELGISSH
jgi:glycosyltransferase involved in cell wall biosynthesis